MSVAAPTKRPEIRTELPGPAAREIIEADAQWVTPSYPRPDYKLVVRRAEGVWVEDVDGNIFLDCNAGVAVCNTGHCHPEVVRAIQEQAAELIHMCGTDFYYRHMPALAQKLDEIVPVPSPTKTHFANSGTEAVETALKLAMHATGRQKFIAFFNSFHGRTLGSLSLTSSKVAQRRGFKRSALDVTHVPYPNAFRHPFTGEQSDGATVSRACLSWIEDRLFKTTTPPEEVAAIVVEAVQGEGGYVPAPQEFLDGLRRICDEHGILLIVDEVQSGMGRTGKMFASDHYGLKPDIITHREGHRLRHTDGRVRRARRPDGLEAGRARFDLRRKPRRVGLRAQDHRAARRRPRAQQRGGRRVHTGRPARVARKHDCIGDVRGLGMMIGVEFVAGSGSRDAAPELRDRVEMECYKRGLILLGAGHNTIRWSPPLILTRENADVALEIFDEAITAAKA